MPHTEIKNESPFEVEVLHLADRDGVPVAVAVTKATYSIQPRGLVLADEQQPIFHAGQFNAEPGKSSYRYEPECAYFKPGTDVALVANAVAPGGPVTQQTVEFSVGALRKTAVVVGDRFWHNGFTGSRLVGPKPFLELPLVYERAFGGWDRSHPDPNRQVPDTRNPMGCGFQRKFAAGEDQLPLPNIEDPSDRISDMDSRPNPVGFGFINPDWQPRVLFAGTYDDAWMANRMPALPADFDLRFFNAASPGLVADRRLTGNEVVRVVGCSHEQVLSFFLPGTSPPSCRFTIAGRPSTVLTAEFDTLVVNTIERIVILTWRCHVQIPRGPEQLLELQVSAGT